MNKPNMSGFFNKVQALASKHSPEILTGIGIAGMITTTVLAVRATPKALRLIDERKQDEGTDELRPVEVVKTTWKCYIPAAVTCVASTACLIGASSVHLKRNAALATAYKLSETALTEYKEKVVQTLGERKERAIKDEIDKDHVEKNPPRNDQIIITDKGQTLCYDHLSGRYFESDINHLKRAENVINRQILNNMYASLNDFYDELDLDHTEMGYTLGWNVDDGLVSVEFSSQITKDDRPAIVVRFNKSPHYGYSSFM